MCEPLSRVAIEVPHEQVAAVMTALGQAEAAIEGVEPRPDSRDLTVVSALLPAEQALRIQRGLPDLMSGEGVMESAFGGYRRFRSARAGGVPVRRRTKAYLASLGMNVRSR